MILTIPSDFKFLGAVDAAVQDLAREFSFPTELINDFSTALVEACSNAIEHGNKFARDKRVSVSVRLEGESFVAMVVDEGDGFDFHAALDDDNPPDMMSERGRGLLIMKAFTDNLRFAQDKTGLAVELTKARVAATGESEAPE